MLYGTRIRVFPFKVLSKCSTRVSVGLKSSMRLDFVSFSRTSEACFSSGESGSVGGSSGFLIEVFDGLCSRVWMTSAKYQHDFAHSFWISSKSSFGRDSICSMSFVRSSWAAIQSSSARCFSSCLRPRIVERISRLYDGRPGRNILAISAVSWSGFFRFMLFALRKSTSNDIKCPIIGKSPTNSLI